MLKQVVIGVGVLGLVGCQPTDQASYVSAPALNPPTVVQSAKPVPPQHLQTTPVAPQHSSMPAGWIPAAPAHAWRWIVIHHSDTDRGSAASFDRYHREVRHWDELGYHFVIGNGTGSADGQVEVGSRWPKQKQGAHAGVLEFNRDGIGICLVGDFNQTRPSAPQMRALARLTAHLMRTYRIPAERVIGHKEAKDGRTNCPGRYMSIATVRNMAQALVGAQDAAFLAPAPLARGELLEDVNP